MGLDFMNDLSGVLSCESRRGHHNIFGWIIGGGWNLNVNLRFAWGGEDRESIRIQKGSLLPIILAQNMIDFVWFSIKEVPKEMTFSYKIWGDADISHNGLRVSEVTWVGNNP